MRSCANQSLLVAIKACHRASHETYGSPRIWEDLKDQGIRCSRKRVARLMQQSGIQGVTRRRQSGRTEEASQDYPAAPNLIARDFSAPAKNRVWLADFTPIVVAEGTDYLSLVLDLYSRRIVGWAMSVTRDTNLTVSALQMALGRRQPEAGLVHHSDRGSQYAWPGYTDLLSAHELIASMSRKGDPYDNAPMESVIGTVKVELVYQLGRRPRKEVRAAVAEYIELFYNSRRRHSALGYLSPAEFERQHGPA